MMIGYMLSTPLYGIVIGQSLYYFRVFPNDSIYLKLVVAFLMAVDTVHTLFLITGNNQWFFNMFITLTFAKELTWLPLITQITVFVCQATYAARIWIVSKKNKYVTGIVILFSGTQFVGGLIMGIETVLSAQIVVVYMSRTFRISEAIQISASLACDLSIVCAMVYFLKGPGRGTTIEKTAHIVNKLIMYIISVGVLTSAATLMNLILWLVVTSNLDFMIIYIITSKLYSNSLLVMLNSRAKLREELYQSNSAIELNTAFPTSKILSGGK